jgi:hypothetical protein
MLTLADVLDQWINTERKRRLPRSYGRARQSRDIAYMMAAG